MISFGDIVQVVATLIAAFAGAWFAFIYQNRQKASAERQEHIAAGNRALATLLQQANTLKLYQVDMIEPFRDDPGRHIDIRPTLQYREEALTFDVKSLNFLLTPKYAEVVFDLIIEEERYREALKAINERTRHHFEVVQQKLFRYGIKDGVSYSDRNFRDALGELDYKLVKRHTDAVVLHVDRTVESLVVAKDRLLKTLLEIYPNEKYINFESLQNPPGSIFKQGAA